MCDDFMDEMEDDFDDDDFDDDGSGNDNSNEIEADDEHSIFPEWQDWMIIGPLSEEIARNKRKKTQ